MQAGCFPKGQCQGREPLRFSNSRNAQSHRLACMLVGMGACQIRRSWVPSYRGERAKMEAWFPHFNIRMGCELGRTCMLIYMGDCQIRRSQTPLCRGERAKMEAWFPHFNIRMGCELGRTCMLIYMGDCQIRRSQTPLCRGERAKMEAWFPHFNIRMGCELGRTCMLIYMVALANAASSPIILPFALWWFIIAWVFWRYSILYVFERSTESGGMVRALLPMWHCIHQCLASVLHLETCTGRCSTAFLTNYTGGLALHNSVHGEPNDDYSSTVRLAVSDIREVTVLWIPFKACCQNHQEARSVHKACTYYGEYCQSQGHEMLLQVWHQIFDKVNWCLFIFGIFTGKQTTLMLI